MKLIIDVDDNLYTRLFDNGVDNYDDVAADMARAIRKGTVLPKGHGRLIDADELMRDYGNSDIEILLENMDSIIEADTEE